MFGGVAVTSRTAKRKVRGSNLGHGYRIWIEVSVLCDHAHPYSASGTSSQWIPESVPSLELNWSEEERVVRIGADRPTSVVKKKHERNPMTLEQRS